MYGGIKVMLFLSVACDILRIDFNSNVFHMSRQSSISFSFLPDTYKLAMNRFSNQVSGLIILLVFHFCELSLHNVKFFLGKACKLSFWSATFLLPKKLLGTSTF